MTTRAFLFTLLTLVLAVLGGACGEGADDGPTFEVVPLECDARLDRYEDVADAWPDPVSIIDLQGVTADMFAVLDGLDDDCEGDVFARLDEIDCGYLTTVEGADEAASTFITSQQARCEDDTGPTPEADPDEPTATIEPGPGPSTTG